MHTDGEIVFQGTFENLLTRVESLMLSPSAVKRHLSSLLSSPSEELKNRLDALYFTCEAGFLLATLDPDELRDDGQVRAARPAPGSSAAPGFDDIVKTMGEMKAQHDRTT